MRLAVLLMPLLAFAQVDDDYAVSQFDVRNGLVRYWSGRASGTNVLDEIGGGDAGLNSGATTSHAAGVIGGGLSFASNAGNRVLFSATGLPTNSFTISMWSRQLGFTSTYQTHVFFFNNAAGQVANVQFNSDGLGTAATKRTYYMRNTQTQLVTYVSNQSPTNYDHIAMTCEDTGTHATVQFWLNGASIYVTNRTWTGSTLGMAQTFAGIGGVNSGAESLFGYVDEVRIYDRAISVDEMRRVYLAGEYLRGLR